MGFLTY